MIFNIFKPQAKQSILIGLCFSVVVFAQERDWIWQNAPIMVLTNGEYAATTTVQKARRNGANGLFAYDNLDGEGVVLDGSFFHVSDDGNVSVLEEQEELVWISLSEFQSEQAFPLEAGFSMDDLSAVIDPKLQTTNAFYAVTIRGNFEIQTRTFSKQSQPFPPFCQVDDVKFEPRVTTGTLVGFRGPGYVAVGDPIINVAQWHLHFISDEGQYAGHVLAFKVMQSAVLSLDKKDSLLMDTPDTIAFNNAYLDTPIKCDE